MRYMFLVGQESMENKHTLSHGQKNNAEIEKDNHFGLTEYNLDCEHITSKKPLILDIKQLKRSRRCSQIHNSSPCTNQVILSNSFDVTSTSTSTAPFCIHSPEFSSESLCISSYKSKKFKQRGKARSIPSLSDFLVECSPVARSRNLVLTPSTRWVVDSIEATLRARTLMKGSVNFPSVSPDVGMEDLVTKSISVADKKSTELLSSHSRLLNTSGNPKAMVIPCRRQRSDLNISQEMPFSFSSSNLTSLCHSNSTEVVNSALLHCVWESGNPYFVFSMGDNYSNVYTASAHKTKSSVDKVLDYIYLFHAWKDIRKESKNSVQSASDIVGKMKARTSLVLNSSRSRYVETEFVLSATKEDSYNEMQRLSTCFTKIKGQSCKLSEIFKQRHYSKSNSIQKVCDSGSRIEDLMRTNYETGCPKHSSDDFLHSLELAAIIVQDFGYGSKHEKTLGGWGLKFLEKVGSEGASSSQGPSSSSEFKKNSVGNISSDRNVNVLIPAGFHGIPTTGTGGPCSLTERWRSNGHCDCGGWDIGCPLTVLNGNSINQKDLLLENSEGDSKSLNLFKEGARHGDLTFKMFSVSKDMYIICFESTLSALQSFSIAVATIHSQTPDLYPIG